MSADDLTYHVDVTAADGLSSRQFDDVVSLTFIDHNSHGQAAVGSLADIAEGGKRLILCSPNVSAVAVEREFDE